MTDNQIVNESFLVYINDLLATGNIPDLCTQATPQPAIFPPMSVALALASALPSVGAAFRPARVPTSDWTLAA